MPALEDFTREELLKITAKGYYRQLVYTSPAEGAYVIADGKRMLSFSSNDYFGLSQHPAVKAAAVQAIAAYGAGAGAARLVTGNHPLYAQLEEQLAACKGTEGACILGSGYLANSGVIAALMGPQDLILADKLSHACLLDGARLSGAKLLRFSHNNIEHCQKLLAQYRASYRHCLIITETIFSMDGDTAPVAALVEVAREHDSWLLTDDAHGLGIVAGEEGVDIQMGTLSKALGSYGGYVAASGSVIDYIRNSARSFMFSTALPPMVIAAASAALDILSNDPLLAAKPLQNARFFTSLIGLPEAQSAIVPLVIGEAEAALAVAGRLKEAGFLVAAIRPPTVPPGTSRLRIAFSALHEEADVERLAAALV